jgi:outer membrane protein
VKWVIIAMLVGLLLPLAHAGGVAAQKEPVAPGTWVRGQAGETALTLAAALDYALRNNPRLKMAEKDIESETHTVSAAQAERMPRVDFGSSASRYRYPQPLIPLIISGPSNAGIEIPDFERSVYDTGVTFRLPLFKGGRLMRGVRVAELRKSMAQDNFTFTRQDLVYNVTSVFYKILQLRKVLDANEQIVKQLEAHKGVVETHLKAGTAPQLDLLKTDVELAHAVERRLVVKNNIDSTFQVFRMLLGMDEDGGNPRLEEEAASGDGQPALRDQLERALELRPDYRAVQKKKKMFEERIRMAQGRWLPDIFVAGDYFGRAGPTLNYYEHWNVGVRLVMPVFDGGLIKAEVDKERTEFAKVQEEERALRLAIKREVTDGVLGLETARERIAVTEKAIRSATENVRVESLKYETGAGTTTDVIDAQTVLLRARTDYLQALFDREVALAYLGKVTGRETAGNGEWENR